jgi:hypothetical protein
MMRAECRIPGKERPQAIIGDSNENYFTSIHTLFYDYSHYLEELFAKILH